MTPRHRLRALLLAALLTGACATRSPLVRQECYNPDAQLARVLKPLEALRATGCVATSTSSTSECDRLALEIGRLGVVCAGHAPTLMANAVLAYDDARPAVAQQWLDTLLSTPGAHADAAVLRARIAIEEGNVRFAQRLVDQQLRLTPDHAGLYELQAAALYLDHRLPEARHALTVAQTLGAPAWRVAYHLGLIEEGSGQREAAAHYYTQALEGHPGWPLAESRLKALRAQISARP